MDRSSLNNVSKNCQSVSPNSSSSRNRVLQPEVLEVLNSKVFKLQQKMQHFVKICIPDLEKTKRPERSPKKEDFFNIPHEDFNKVTKKASENYKTLNSPFITPRSTNSRKKLDLRIGNISPEHQKFSPNTLSLNKKTKSLFHLQEKTPKDAEICNIDQLKLQKLFSLSKNFLKNIIKLCNTCPEIERVPFLVSENCKNFAIDLDKIEKNDKIVSFVDDSSFPDDESISRIKERYELKLLQSSEKINELIAIRTKLVDQLTESKKLIISFSEKRSLSENDLLVKIIKKLNKFSTSFNIVANKTKQSLNAMSRRVKELLGAAHKEREKIKAMELELAESKSKILELQRNISKLNSFKSENILLVTDLAKAADSQDHLKKTLKFKETELKKVEKDLQSAECEKNQQKDLIKNLQSELNEIKELLNKMNIKFNQEIDEYKHSNILQQHQMHKLEKEKSLWMNEEKALKKKILDAEEKSEKSESKELEKLKNEKIALENSLEGYYKILKEKLALEEKLENFEEIFNEKNDLNEKFALIEAENKRLAKELEEIKSLNTKKKYQTELNEIKLSEAKDEISELLKKLKDSENLQTQILSLNKQLKNLSELENENFELREKIQDLQKRIKDSDSIPNNSELLLKEIEQKNTESKNLHEKLAELESLISSLKSQIATLQEQKDHQVQSNSKLSTKISDLEKDIKTLTEKLLSKSEEISNLEEKLNLLNPVREPMSKISQDNAKIIKNELILTKTQLNDTINELNESKVRVTYLKNSVSQLESQNKKLNEKIALYERGFKNKNDCLRRKSNLNFTNTIEFQDSPNVSPNQNPNSEFPQSKKSILRKFSKEDNESMNRVSFEPPILDTYIESSPGLLFPSKSLENF